MGVSGKLKLVGDTARVLGLPPLPLNGMIWEAAGPPLETETIVIVALRSPCAMGLKLALSVQLLLALSVADAQLSAVMAKSPGLVPPSVTLLTVTGLELLLVTVKTSVALALPTSTPPKKKLVGEMVSGGGPET